ncbi:MAG: hypothetical protein R3C19_06095 [Planctomycetaceae bacterium]
MPSKPETDNSATGFDSLPPPESSRITCSRHANGVTIQIPQTQGICWPAALQAIIVLCIAGELTHLVVERQFVWKAAFAIIAVVWTAGLVLASRALTRMRTRGAIAVSEDTLAVIEHRVFRRSRRAWSIAKDVIDVQLASDAEGHRPHGLIVNSTEDRCFEYFRGLSTAELQWIVNTIQNEVEQSQLQAAGRKLGLPQRPVEEWSESDFRYAEQRIKAISADRDREIAEMQAKMDRLEFSLTDFVEWQPGKRIVVKRVRPTAFLIAAGSIGGVVGSAVVNLFIAPFATPLVGFVVGFAAYLFPAAMRRNVYLAIADVFSFGGTNIAWLYCAMMLVAGAVLFLKLDAAFSQREVVVDWDRRLLSVMTPRSEQTYSLPYLQRLCIRTVRLPRKHLQPDDAEDTEVDRQQSQIVGCFPEGDAVILESDKAELSNETANERVLSVARQLASAMGVTIESDDVDEQEFDSAGYPRHWKLKYLPRVWQMASTKARRVVIAALCIVVIVYGIRLIRAYEANARSAPQVGTQHGAHAASIAWRVGTKKLQDDARQSRRPLSSPLRISI